ncbi:hypothetical protein GX50_04953 [[Emmonsia] crescens]|uniref:F-box domain-containing protein n=1 Tax=[Emmonsia] crescens TaxID=73230 RepID=A0A2B7ZE87_9EURO|nr:hypothetical protein GX50_04953 [Emmonsia crescens]
MTAHSAVACPTLSSTYQALLGNDATLKRTLLRLRENTSVNDFLPCLLVCKKWYSLALDVLQAAVVLRNHSLRQLLKGARLPLNSRPHAILSLTLLLDVTIVDSGTTTTAAAAAGPWGLGGLLKDLSKIIAGDMRALQIFSIRIDHQQQLRMVDLVGDDDIDGITAEPGFPAAALIALVASLPETCSNVEIDTLGFEVYTDDEHLCPQIAKLLPNLTHLRLRIRQLCCSLIDLPVRSFCHKCPGGPQAPLCPKLRSLVINMELSSVIQGGISRCSPSSQTRSAGEKSNHTGEDLQTELSHHLLLGLASKNCFPAAERIEIHAPINLDSPPWHHIRQTDIKNCKTHISSFIPLPGYIQGVWRLGTHRYMMRPTTTRKGPGGVIISSWYPHPREHTGNAWISTSEGVSLPTSTYSHTLSIYDMDDYHLFPYKGEEMEEEDEEDQAQKPHYHRSLSAYVNEMTQRWRQNRTGETAQSQSHPIYKELCRVVGVNYELNLRAQTYHTLRPIPLELFPFPDPVPMEWYGKQTPLGHADFGRVGEGCCCLERFRECDLMDN